MLFVFIFIMLMLPALAADSVGIAGMIVFWAILFAGAYVMKIMS